MMSVTHIYLHINYFFIPHVTGYSRLWLCAEGPTAAASEASHPTEGPRIGAHTVPLALLRRTRTFLVGGNLEASSQTAEASRTVSIISVKLSCPALSKSLSRSKALLERRPLR